MIVRTVNPTIANKAFEALGLMHVVDGILVTVRGVYIAKVPDFPIVSGEYDNNGNEIKAPVYPQQEHYNIRISSHALYTIVNEEVPTTVKLADHLATFFDDAVNANVPAQANKNEVAWKWKGIEIIDPSTINTPRMNIL